MSLGPLLLTMPPVDRLVGRKEGRKEGREEGRRTDGEEVNEVRRKK